MSARTLATLTRFVFVLAIGTGCARHSPAEPDAIGKPQNTSPAIGAAGATATDNPAARVPITFTLKGCPNLPAGLIVYGSGDDFLVINSRVDQDGNTHMERNDLVTGTATDSDGASYKFNYHNHSNIVVPPDGFPWSFATTDHFNLIGNGRANRMQVSFVARVTFPSPNDPPLIEFVNSRGDPFFCDPI
jgi:hypothetical protein